MADNNIMNRLRIFFGLGQEPPRNDFRNPIWSSDDEDDGDELYTRQQIKAVNDTIDLHQELTKQMDDVFRTFGGMFGDMKSFFHDDPVDSFTTMEPPPEQAEPDNYSSNSIRDYYLKPGYHNRRHEHAKEDIDLDGKISSNDISGLLRQKTDDSIGSLVPFSGSMVPGRSFCKTIITTSVTKSDGTVETRRIVKNGNDVVEETTTSMEPDNRGPLNPGLDNMTSPGFIYSHVMSELSSLFRNFY